MAVLGLDEIILKTGTISDTIDTQPIREIVHNVAPIVKVSIKPEDPSKLNKLL